MREQARFTYEKSTKNTHRYQETGDPENQIIGAVYIKKSTFEGEAPRSLTITIEAD